MNDQLSMFWETTSEVSPSAISSPGLASGLAPSETPAGPKTAPSGPEAHPVSRFRSQDSGRAMPTNDISGPLFNASSPSSALQFCLESKLRQRMAGSGSALFAMTWRALDMPAGAPLCQQQASGRRTFATGFTGSPWPTPNVADDNNSRVRDPQAYSARRGVYSNLATTSQALAAWPTPNTSSGGRSISTDRMDATGKTTDGRKHTASLEHAAKFAGWSTPSARDWKDSEGMSVTGVNPDGTERTRLDQLPRQANLASWPTPVMQDAESSARHGYMDEGHAGTTMLDAARLASWPTPRTADAVAGPDYAIADRMESGGMSLPTTAALAGPARLTASGHLRIGSSAGIGSGGQLHPAHSRWLMGLPSSWDRAAPSKVKAAPEC